MTAQIHEDLIYNGEELSMAFCPPLPEGHPRIKTLSDEEVKAMKGGGIMFSTVCWRRYIGTWEIKDNRFYLVRLEGQYSLDGDEPLFADWFTGVLRIPQGRMVKYVHTGFKTEYEREVHIEIDNGIVTKTQTINNSDN